MNSSKKKGSAHCHPSIGPRLWRQFTVYGFITQCSTLAVDVVGKTESSQVVLELSSIPLVRHETCATVLLHREAEALCRETNDSRYYAEVETSESGGSATGKSRRSLSRPLRLLALHPVIQIQSLLEGIN